MNRNRIFRSVVLASSCILATLTIFGQQVPFNQTYKDYIAPEAKGGASATIIVVLDTAKGQHPGFTSGTKILRQLNDSVFIIKYVDGKINTGTQFPANNNWKLSPGLLYKMKAHLLVFPIAVVISSDSFPLLAESIQKKTVLLPSSRSKLIDNVSEYLFQILLTNENIEFIGEYHRSPQEELQINNLDLSANRVNQLHSNYPEYKGDGLVVSIKENRPDSADIDLKGRYISNPLESPELSPHATIMATMAAGAGNSYYLGRGVAQSAGITSSNYSNLFPDADQNYQQFHISVQNHSYGVGVENFYGADAAAFDETAVRNDSLIFVFSAGNSGLQTSTSGSYSGLAGVANLTGSFKMAKNILTAGATDSFGVVAPQSSRGPAFDGRLKPELVAFGEDGSSGAAALVSGTAIVLQDAYKQTHGNIFPPSDLIKAIILNTCDDVDRQGIDFNSGYGALNANRAMTEILRGDLVSDKISAAAPKSFPLLVPANIRRVRVLLTWTDPPAAPNAFKALTNDLDLQIKSPTGLATWLPWVLNSAPVKDSLILLPVRKRDSLNTIEQVTIDNPAPGNYNIIVNAFNLKTANQQFALSVVYDTANFFEWNFPTANDNVFPGIQNLLRWNNSFANNVGALDYSVDQGANWRPIESALDLSRGYYRWNAPDSNVSALLRMTVNSTKYSSDTFSISSKLNLRVGFNCDDSILLFWNKINGVNGYRVYGLGDKFLQPFINTTDTQAIISKKSQPFSQFAVASLLNSRPGVKSYTIDYSSQGVACYISNLTADLQNDSTAFIHLTIGTAFNIGEIVLEKLIASKFTAIKTFQDVSVLDFTFTDPRLVQGGNIYRAAIHLKDGRIIYSYTTTVNYLSTFEFLAYPSPLQRGSIITIQFKELHNQTMKLMDASGRLMTGWKALNTTVMKALWFPAGLYFLEIADPERHSSKTIKVIIL